jgi:hypothetical protein
MYSIFCSFVNYDGALDSVLLIDASNCVMLVIFNAYVKVSGTLPYGFLTTIKDTTRFLFHLIAQLRKV